VENGESWRKVSEGLLLQVLELQHLAKSGISKWRVRFPSPAPLIINDLRKSAGKVQENDLPLLAF
jgi:hypothetical protein